MRNSDLSAICQNPPSIYLSSPHLATQLPLEVKAASPILKQAHATQLRVPLQIIVFLQDLCLGHGSDLLCSLNSEPDNYPGWFCVLAVAALTTHLQLMHKLNQRNPCGSTGNPPQLRDCGESPLRKICLPQTWSSSCMPLVFKAAPLAS